MSLSNSSDGNQLALFELHSFDTNNNNYNSYWDVTNDSGASYEKPYIKRNFNAPESPHGWISFSKAAGSARGNNCYFRYSYRAKNKILHKHIRGGNITKFKAIINAKKVSDKIRLGWRAPKIIQFIDKL